MTLTDPTVLRLLLERHGLQPQKRWGQHFLTSSRVVDAIVDRFAGYAGILEVGPGPGVLTHRLSLTATKLIAVEVDPIAVSALTETAPTAEVVQADALSIDLEGLFARLPEPRGLVSNMPYNITGPLVTAFAEARAGFGRAVLMMQREVAVRILARPGSSDFGSLSVYLQSQFAIERVTDAPPGCFYPPPKVESVVLQLTPLVHGHPTDLERLFFAVVRSGFQQPRKTLANNLAGFRGLGRERVEQLLEHQGFDRRVRPHQIPVEAWKALSLAIADGT
ncbi:MAG TPA: 16S rRNA (adenine(1518)-N(6)/adenine(1519)-N(6))-dimethyltransferase RsmA [Fimbriimonadaceae bacterium]|nr:16S rRNA (adenine(1518)-N(6)/adenine(1519)-N(6))-dimethyltransferase RsmA [Fimbriimonadaceae bacterium]